MLTFSCKRNYKRFNHKFYYQCNFIIIFSMYLCRTNLFISESLAYVHLICANWRISYCFHKTWIVNAKHFHHTQNYRFSNISVVVIQIPFSYFFLFLFDLHPPTHTHTHVRRVLHNRKQMSITLVTRQLYAFVFVFPFLLATQTFFCSSLHSIILAFVYLSNTSSYYLDLYRKL